MGLPTLFMRCCCSRRVLFSYHSFMVNACKFTVDAKYQPLKPLGRGAYGVVWYETQGTGMHEPSTARALRARGEDGN
jgi:hypothetical protein